MTAITNAPGSSPALPFDTALAEPRTVAELPDVSALPQPPVLTPELAAMDLPAAFAAATAVGLCLAVSVRETQEGPWGHVLIQRPVAGSRIRPGTRISIEVAGRPHVRVPELRGMDAAEARAVLHGLGLHAVVRQLRSSRTIRPGRVISTDQRPGTLLPDGSSVGLVIARGPRT